MSVRLDHSAGCPCGPCARARSVRVAVDLSLTIMATLTVLAVLTALAACGLLRFW